MSAPVLSWSFNALRKGTSVSLRRPLVPSQATRPAGGPSVRTAYLAVHYTGASPKTPRPDPQSQSFSRSYGSILPTSLIYIVLSTRGYTPWRPDAVMSTPRGANKVSPSDFQGPSEAHRTGGRSACFTSYLTLSPGKPIPG